MILAIQRTMAFILILVFVNLFGFTYLRYKRLPPKPPRASVNERNKLELIEYSRQTLNYVKQIVFDVAAQKIDEFINRKWEGPPLWVNYKTLIQEIGDTAYKSINHENIMFDQCLFTKDYYVIYIKNLVMSAASTLLEQRNIIFNSEEENNGRTAK